MIPTFIGALLALFGFAAGVVVGYGLFYLEYQPFVGYLRAVRIEKRMADELARMEK